MQLTQLDDKSALVLIDLQKGILGLPTVRPAQEILQQGIRLAEAFRAHGKPVVLVNVGWSADGGDLPVGRAASGRMETPPPTGFSELADGLAKDGDIRITKRHWGAFTGTELDLQLRRRGITQIVLAGISTSIGVESTARFAWELGYTLAVIEDATTDTSAESHEHSFRAILPRIAEIGSADGVIALLDA
ncbi:isochorismatase family protein [Streptomyces sp. YC504]|uniref:Isochorismatase family protein n=1 Tax=Streptomyces mesophilus TaxID=1775132 RepID=A0A6G4XVT9_9ACTN|nr:isochorismatase family protein [Streptomyces mesophilus]NGO81696.1 isochorismatase family protein [Streptomyces mesophilus]